MLTGAVANGLTTLFRGFQSPVGTSGPDLATAETATATPDRPANLPAEGSVAGQAEPGAAVVFDRVSLAFDEQVVLRDVSFRDRPGACGSCSAPAARGNPSCSS